MAVEDRVLSLLNTLGVSFEDKEEGYLAAHNKSVGMVSCLSSVIQVMLATAEPFKTQLSEAKAEESVVIFNKFILLLNNNLEKMKKNAEVEVIKGASKKEAYKEVVQHLLNEKRILESLTNNPNIGVRPERKRRVKKDA